ncbi:hypothetical protein EVAR_100456_1 [Eumeta japonica]|uniref:Uncharacterized protein n=1 Tax=Eumeta variegata TaxID=151549 RepID=A0A4C1SB04_EUMVA|nr:hypothetical protein EVAR_100456_1 [Eumeta japonica]
MWSKITASAVTDPYALRKAMGLSFGSCHYNSWNCKLNGYISTTCDNNLSSLAMDIDEDVAVTAGGDLENELREFLESGPGLHAAASSSADDNNLMAQLLMN